MLRNHWTTKGRVVYDRKKHFFTIKDIIRVMKSWMKSQDYNDELTIARMSELNVVIQYMILSEQLKVLRLTMPDWVGSEIVTQQKKFLSILVDTQTHNKDNQEYFEIAFQV